MRIRQFSLAALAAALTLYGCGKDNPTTSLDTASAVTKPASGTESRDRTSKFVEQLGLTDEQQKALEDLRAAQKAEAEAIRNSDAERSDIRKQMKAAREKYRDALMALLTDEQKAKFEEIRANHGSRRGGFKGRKGPRAGGGHLIGQLDLTEDQQQALENLKAAQKTEVEAIRNSDAERSDIREQMKAAREKFQDELMALLTDEQKAKYEELKAAIKQRIESARQSGSKAGRRGNRRGRPGHRGPKGPGGSGTSAES